MLSRSSRSSLRQLGALRTAHVSRARFASSSTKSLRETLQEVIPIKQEQLKKLRTEHAEKVVGDVRVGHIIGGMRGLKAMLWEASVLDPNEGIRFHGMTIPDCQKVLPPAHGGKEIIPESMFWFLLTGQVPSEAQVRAFSKELAEQGTLDDATIKLIDGLEPHMHPMTQLGIAVASLNTKSKFAAAYEKGIKKSEYWTYTLEDSLDLIAKLPSIAARIYYNIKTPGKRGTSDCAHTLAVNPKLDLVGNYVEQMGLGGNDSLTEYLRLYIALHGDHEGGNVSAHTSHLVGSALSDPYLSYSAALFGLAGPLHGLANQEVLRWILAMQQAVGSDPSPSQVKDYLWKTLNSGRVVPGYGHGVLRSPDPRFTALQEFCDARPELNSDPIIKIVKMVSEIAPGVLVEHGKTKNPYPNVDATSGCLLYHYGLTEFKYYTVIFGVSRAIGCLTQLVWDRAFGLPIERPKSLSLGAVETLIKG